MAIRYAAAMAALLLGIGGLHCDSAPPPEPEAPAAPEAAAPAPEPAAAEVELDPLQATKAEIASARKQFERATDPIDVDVYRVEYVLLLRRELEKVGLPKSALDRMSRRQLEERARRKGLLD